MYSLHTDVIVQVIIGEPLKALMLLCRGIYLTQMLLCRFAVVNLLKHWCYGAEVLYLVFSSGMENGTLSQICDRLYLPIFLLRVGLVTLMYMASLMVLAIPCPSLPIILNFSTDIVWPVTLLCSNISDGAFRCFLYLSSKVLADSQCTHHHIQSCHIYTSI